MEDNYVTCKRCKSLIPDAFAFCPKCGRALKEFCQKTRRRKKGTGTIVKLGGNRLKPWAAKKNGILLGTFEEEWMAEQFLAARITDNPGLLNYTLSQIFERVKHSPQYLNQTMGSQKNICMAWTKMEPIADKKAREIKTTDFQGVIDLAHENGCGRDGCSKVKNLASMLCMNAMLDDIMLRDYSEGIALPNREEGVNRRNFTQDEIITLFYNDDDRVARIVLIMIYSALRLGELFGILKRDVNLEKGYMMGGEKTVAGRNRIIPIKDEIYPYIANFMQEPGDYLIGTKKGLKMHESNFRNREFYPLLDRLKFDYKDDEGRNRLTPHRTRHTYISASIEAGVKPEVLKLVVGHASYKTSVENYGKEARLETMQQEVKKSF